MAKLQSSRRQVVGPAAEDAAVVGNPVLTGGRYDSTARALETGDVGALAVDVAGRPLVVGPAAENAAVVGSPVLVGGRYDASDRTLGDGDVGAIAVDVAGKVKLSATITGSNTVQDNAGNTDVQAKGDDRGVQYQRAVGQEPITGRSLTVPVAVTGTLTTAIQLTARDYLCDKVVVVFRNRNTDAEGLVGDVVAQTLELKKGEPLPLGAVDPKTVYLKAHTTAGDDADAILTLRDRPDYRDMLLEAIMANGGAYWPFEERSGTALVDVGLGTKGPHDLLLSGATVADAGVFGLGVDLDGVNDTIRQKSETVNSGTVSIVDTPTFTLDDTGAVFTAAIRDGNHWVIIKDLTGTRASAYIGTSNVDGDGTKVQLYTTTARSTLGYAASETGWDPTDTPLTFTVHKELHTVGSFSLGLWFWNDAPTVLAELASIDSNVTNKKTFYLLTTANRKYDITVFSSTSSYTAASTNLGRAVEAAPVFISMTFEASTRLTLYVNGREEAENVTSIPATTNQPLTPLCLGAQNVLVTAANFSNGRLSHPFYIRAAMKDNWHRSLYEAGRR